MLQIRVGGSHEDVGKGAAWPGREWSGNRDSQRPTTNLST
jgi:hypothetical protein